MKRCNKCLLPENYPRIFFNEEGVCNFCTAHKNKSYLGMDSFCSDIKSFLKKVEDRNNDYDCVVGFSGGRDSSYLLYLLKKYTDFRIIAYTSDNGFISESAKQNIRNITQKLDIDLVIENNDYLEKCFSHHFNSWVSKPTAPMIGMLCTGCRLGIDNGLFNFARKNKIPVIVSGATPFEGNRYKQNILKIDPNSSKKSSLIFGYLSQIKNNPGYVANLSCLSIQLKEFYVHFLGKNNTDNLLFIHPFGSYIHWKEEEVVSTIKKELEWKQDSKSKSTWRSDCDIALLKLYLYKKALGFNDKDDGLSCLIHDGQITRSEAFERLKCEGDVPDDVIYHIVEDFGFDVEKFKSAVRKLEKEMNSF